MATTPIYHRVVRIPYSSTGPAQQVKIEMLAKLKSLALAGTNVLTLISEPAASFNEPLILQMEADMVPANDATFVTFLAGWATILGVALIDTVQLTGTTVLSGY